MDDDTRELTERAARGDQAAVEELLTHHLPALRAFVRLRTGERLRRRESCSDLVQSTCREILANAGRFQHPTDGAFRHWLFTTALRKIANRAEYHAADKRAIDREQPTEDLEGAGVLACYRRFSSPSHRVQVADEMERVERAFDQLTEEQREVLTLAHVAGLSRAEIAKETGRAEGAVRSLLHRAMVRVSEVLDLGE